jgi:regulator of replication initiation timing
LGFPEERLAALIEENASMKIELETYIEKLKHYKYLVDEQKRALDDEIKKSTSYRNLIS